MQTPKLASSTLVLVSAITLGLLLLIQWPVWSALGSHPQFWLARWLPLIAIVIGIVRWPWNKQWIFNIDAIGTWLIMSAVLVLTAGFFFAEPLLLALATALVGWAVSRGVYVANVRPLCGVWLPTLFPLLLLAGVDQHLDRWHDQLTSRYTQILLDAIAVPNNGLTMLPAQDDSFVYDLSPSGCGILSWGTWVGIATIIAAAFARRFIPMLFMAATAYFLGFAASLSINLLPAYTERFLGNPWRLIPPADGESAPTFYLAILLTAMTLITMSVDQFWKFIFSRVEPDQDSSGLVLSVSRVWNRLMSNELSTRRMRLVTSQAVDNPVASGLLIAVLVLAVVFVWRISGTQITNADLAFPKISQATWQVDSEQATSIDWVERKRYPGSRQGDRSWIWVTSIQEREVVFRLDYSASSQTDVAAEMRLLKWRSIDPLSAEKPAVWDWDRATQQRVRVVVQALPLPQEANTTGLVTRDLIGHFPNWQGNCLFDPRLDGALQRRPLTAWAFTEYMGELPSDFSEQLQTQFKSFVEAMTGTKSL